MLNYLRLLCCLLFALVCFTQLGCQPAPPAKQEELPKNDLDRQIPDTITMLIVDDHGSELGESIARQWTAESGGELKVVPMAAAEFAAVEFEIPATVDVIVFPTPMLGELESRRGIKEFPSRIWTSSEFNRGELLQIYRAKLVRHNNRNWGVPLGGPQFGLMYDRQWWDQQQSRRPALWEDLKHLASTTIAEPTVDANDAVDVDRFESIIELPLGEGWAAQVFLLRVAPMIRSRGRLSTVFDRDTMRPLISSLPFQIALNDLKQLMGNDLAQLEYTPADVYQNVLDGKTAMGITWLHPQIGPSESACGRATESLTCCGFANIPGDSQWYDTTNQRWIRRNIGDSPRADLIGFNGRLAAVSSQSRSSDQAFEFLAWLGNKTTALKTIVGDAEFGPFRASHLGDPSRWAGELISEQTAIDYAEVIQSVQEQDALLMFPRIPGYARYLDALDRNIRRCLKNEIDTEQALLDTAEQWEKITEEIGRQRLILELRKDAGI